MQTDLEGDSSFSCGIVYSQAPATKPPRREGEALVGCTCSFGKDSLTLHRAAHAAEPVVTRP